MKTITLAATVALLSACAQPSQSTAPAPAPSLASVEIRTPAAPVPAEFARFSGIWAGTWGTNLDGKLAVTTIAVDGSITGVYAIGEAKGVFKANQRDVTGQITGDTLTLETFRNGAVTTYKYQGDETLAGTYLLKGRPTEGIFRAQ